MTRPPSVTTGSRPASIRSLGYRLRRWPVDRSLGNVLLATVIGLDALLILSTIVLIHYLGVDALTSLLYVGTEICSPEIGAIGVHCFGDYNLGSILAMDNPWDYVTMMGAWNYPAASMVPSHLFIGLGHLINRPSVALVLYLVVMVAGMTVPAIWASWGRPVWTRIAIWAAFGFLSVPALMAMDRGNVVGFAVAPMLIAVVAFARKNYLWAAIGIALASCAKPQFALAILAFAFFGRWMWLLICAGMTIVVNILPFMLWPKAFPGSIWQAVTGMLTFGGQSTLGSDLPVSISFAKGFYLLEEWFGAPLRAGGSPGWVEENQGVVSALTAIVLVVVVAVGGRAVGSALVVSLLFLISAMLVPTSFTYYLIAMLPLAAIVLRDPALDPELRMARDTPSVFRGVLDREGGMGWPLFVASVLLTIALAASVSRVYYPKLVPEMPVFIYTTADFVTILWMIAIPTYVFVRMGSKTRDAAPVTSPATADVTAA